MDNCLLQISVNPDLKNFSINCEQISQISQVLLSQLGLADFDLSVSFVSSEMIHELNQKYRHKNRPTDVLSFPQLDWEGPLCIGMKRDNASPIPESLGDIVISPENAKRNASLIGHGLDREIAFLLVHGLLHLCGHDHIEREQEQLMCAQQKLLFECLENPANTKPLWSSCIQSTELN